MRSYKNNKQKKWYQYLSFKALAFICIYLTLLTRIELIDIDYFYHVKTGEYIVQHFSLPQTDIFSYTMHDKHWVVHEWLFEVILYVTKLAASDVGIKLLTISLFTLSLWIIYRILEKLKVKFLLAVFLLVGCYLLMQGGLSPRPHLVSYVFFPVYLYALINLKYFNTTKGLWFLPIVMVFWSNLHGGYMLGAIVLMAFLISEYFILWVTEQKNDQYRIHLKTLLWVTLATIVATGLKPTGFSEWLFPFQITSLEHIKYVQEWKSPTFDGLHGKLYLIIVILYFISAIYSNKKPDLTELGLPISIAVLGFISIRHVPLAVMTLSLFIGVFYKHINFSMLDQIYRKIPFPAALKHQVDNGKQLGNTEYVMNWILLCLAIMIFCFIYPIHQQKHEEKYNKVVPVEAYKFIKDQKIDGNIFNSQYTGGYLISQFYPEKGVFIDGRGGDLYGDKFYLNYIKMVTLSEGWEKLFNQHDINYMLVEHFSPLAQILTVKNTFKLVYDDGYYSVLVKNSPNNQRIIQQFERDWMHAGAS